MMSLISYKTDNRGITLEEVGGKGFNLFKLKSLAFCVPPWFVVSSRLFSDTLHSKREMIDQIIAASLDDNGSLERASEQIRIIILEVRLPDEFLQSLSAMAMELGDADGVLSVRSSVVDEDSSASSFAGQMDSYLNVPRAEVAFTIKKVWASAFSSRALLYRKKKNLSFKNIVAAVVVQRMVQADSSGILFTKDPETAESVCVISAGYGLGEGVVANHVDTDTYKIPWQSNEIAKDIRSKDGRIVLDADSGHGTRLEQVETNRKSVQVLTDEQILLLRDVATKAEKDFGTPQDIEWAFDQHGSLFILQARPIVFSATRPAMRIWDNSNIVESYPGLTLPLTFTFVRGAYERAFRNAAFQFYAFKEPLRKSQHIFRNMIGLLHGRVYYNLLNWYEMLSFLPGFQKHKKSWDLMIGISKKIEFPQSKLTGINAFLSLLLTIWLLLTVRRNAAKFFKHFWPLYRRFSSLNIAASSEHELIRVYRNLEEDFHSVWHLTLVNDFCAMKYYDWLKSLCKEQRLAQHVNLHNDLLCGESGVESVAPVRSLISMAQIVRSNEDYRLLLSSCDNESAWDVIKNNPSYKRLKEALDHHLEEFGDRGLEELKLEMQTFRDDRAQVLDLVKSYVPLDMTVEKMELQEQAVRLHAENIVQQHIHNPLMRMVFRFVLRKTRLAVKNRENMRFARTRVHGIARRLFRRMGELFAMKGLIECPKDIYYLTLEEVFGIVEGTATTQRLKRLVEIRKEEYRGFSGQSLSERIETSDIPYLGFLGRRDGNFTIEKTLTGIGCSSGIARGTASVVLDPKQHTGTSNHILVAKSTDPGWVFLMISSKGIIVEKGSVLSHTAIIGRELGIPTIVGVADATRRIQEGAEITMDGSTGVIEWL